ncbi:hypothetical protein [Haloactinomyces albus]|uniref:Uncharacterized protein n=1 Tax=Haloactinomyces albus TaxID=1352928 RepID=A0AAE4CN38_9ACTN|nr:hypothetical protein [Haloactinomyces albus]MDR7303041.1 hypothetical protein [Haloactinomyces albus]
MDYVVTAALQPPVQATVLDELQQEGVVSLLDRQLGQVEGVTGPESEEIDVLDYRINASAEGVTVMLALDAPSLRAAEEAAAQVLDELIGESEQLVNWTVAQSEVRITEDEFNQSLAAASGSSEEPRDEIEAALEAAVDEALGDSETSMPGTAAPDGGSWRDRLIELAPRLRAFDSTAFAPSGEADQETTRLAAGALIHAVSVVTDELFYDELALTINDATVREAVGLLVLEELPPCYQHRYDSRFTRALLLSSAAVAARLTERSWTPPRCVAESLALRLLVNEARVVLEAAELLEWEQSEPLFATFTGRAFADTGHEELYEVDFPLVSGAEFDEPSTEISQARIIEVEDALRVRGLAFEQWFQVRAQEPFENSDGLHPYLP